MRAPSRKTVVRYGVALLAATAAAGPRGGPAAALGWPGAYLAFELATLTAAGLGGLGPGLLAAALGASGATTWADLAARASTGIALSGLIEALRRARRRGGDGASRRAPGAILAELAHELRTPLSPVLPAVARLLESGPPADARRTLEMIHRNVELQARLIDDLLDLARIEHGKLRLRPEPVDLHELIGRIAETCGPEAEAARVRLDLDLAARRPRVRADATRLQQVLWNLVRNAVRHTPPGGTITVSSRDAAGAGPGEAPRLLVAVADTGAGIGRDDLARIFEPFEQGRVAGDGLGLGLAISRSIAEAHGGRLTAASGGPGRGSRFTLELPAPEPSAATRRAAPPTRPAPAEAARPLKILLVDDNEDILHSLALALGRRGHVVTTAESVASACEAVEGEGEGEGEGFDLLISDLELPDGSGLDLMRSLRASGPVPGIALSGYGSGEDLQLSRAAGFSAHLIKPVPLARLEAAIRRVAGDAVAAR